MALNFTLKPAARLDLMRLDGPSVSGWVDMEPPLAELFGFDKHFKFERQRSGSAALTKPVVLFEFLT
jgi:hypothetical protein